MMLFGKTRMILSAGAIAVLLAACGQGEVKSVGETPVATDYAAVAPAAVASEERLAGDSDQDARRKPAAALEFFKVAPGMTVFEIEAGGGWYTELLYRAVGPDGLVIMQNPPGMEQYVGDELAARFADGRLSDVRQTTSIFDKFDAEDASVDLVTWVQGPHELYFKPENGSLGDPEASYAEIFRIVKPGGAFAVIDHSAEAGAPETVGHDLHRVDPAIVIAMAEAAGFMLEAESSFLANPADLKTTSVFDESIRGETDQFALRFRKP